ncbi:MAG: Rieske 2Fe-2S domain-containing protein [Sandaracinaceae bacterium]
MKFVRVCDADELWDGEMDAFDVGEEEILLVRLDGAYRAFQGICPHQSVSLAEGSLEGTTLTCRAHLWQFNACTGQGINPAKERLRRYPVEVRDGGVFVATEALAEPSDA